MTANGASATLTDHDGRHWDEAANGAGGHLLQSWRWGTFKGRHGWSPERVVVERGGERAMAQLLLRSRGPLRLAYLPRGPVLSRPDPDLAGELFAAVDRRCRSRGAMSLVVEPNEPLPLDGRFRDHGFVRGPGHIQPGRTVKVPLLADEPLLMQMHQKTRYNIRHAQRQSVGITAAADGAAVAAFYGLLVDTAERNRFAIHPQAYYADFLATFGEDAVLLFATIEDRPVAGLIAARFGDEAIYMYGASSTQHRAHGAAFFLQFAAMRWARERGCARYDLWGIPVHDPSTTRDDGGGRIAPTRGEDWRGLYEFKVRFGGNIVTYPPALERRYLPVLPALARRFYGRSD